MDVPLGPQSGALSPTQTAQDASRRRTDVVAWILFAVLLAVTVYLIFRASTEVHPTPPPPYQGYWQCVVDANGRPTGTCRRTTQPTPWKTDAERQLCEQACVPAGTYFVCEYAQGTGGALRTGRCLPSQTGEQGAFQCPTPGDCSPSSCPANYCADPQYWKCSPPGGPCSEVAETDAWDFRTDPSQPNGNQGYYDCASSCTTRVRCPSPGNCQSVVSVKSADGAPLPSGTTVAQWCATNCAPPSGTGFAWSGTDAQGTCVPVSNCSPGSSNCPYSSLLACLASQCPQRRRGYCPGASSCAPPETPNAICCNGTYCDPTRCEQCLGTPGRCLDGCAYDPTGVPKDRPCGSCDGQGNCTTERCQASQMSECVCEPGHTYATDPSRCQCQTVDCQTPITGTVWSSGTDSKWWCPTGGWCLTPDRTRTSTSREINPTAGVCRDGSQCVLLPPLPLWPPDGAAGCWPYPNELQCTDNGTVCVPAAGATTRDVVADFRAGAAAPETVVLDSLECNYNT